MGSGAAKKFGRSGRAAGTAAEGQRGRSGGAAGKQRESSGSAAAGPPCGGQQGDSYNTLLEPSSETLLGNKNARLAVHQK